MCFEFRVRKMLSACRFVKQVASRGIHTSVNRMASMKIAIIGQSQFGLEVYKSLRLKGHEIVGVFTIPDVKGKPDILASGAEEDGVKVFKFPRWRTKGEPIKDVVEAYKACGAELNVLPFCSQFIPMNVIDFPKHGSIIYHPSLLPRHRGASAINWWVDLICFVFFGTNWSCLCSDAVVSCELPYHLQTMFVWNVIGLEQYCLLNVKLSVVAVYFKNIKVAV